MKTILAILSFCLLGLGHTVNGQQLKRIDVSVRDNAQKPASGTLVELVNADSLTLVQYAITAKDGSVEFKNVKDGKYIVFIPAVNGINYTSSALTISNTMDHIRLSVITLNRAAANSVTITGRALFVKNNKIVSAS